MGDDKFSGLCTLRLEEDTKFNEIEEFGKKPGVYSYYLKIINP